MKLLIKKIIIAYKYENLYLRTKIFFSSQYQKKIILPLKFFFFKENFAKLDYSSGFSKNYANINNKKNYQLLIIKKIINFYHRYLKKVKKLNGIWEENMQIKLCDLSNALLNKNEKKLSKIFNNMFRNPLADGLCVGYEHFINSQNLFGKIYIKTQFNNYLKELKKNKINLNKLKVPNIGNPSGIKYKNNIFSIETLRHANQAFTMTTLTSNIKEPKILEIGGGIGGTCFQYIYSFNNNKNIKYYLVDILEVLTLAGYCFHKKRALTFTKKNKSKHQIFLIPKDNLNLIKKIKFDLIFNSCSLSEMDLSECNKYERLINTCSKKKSIFYHINHDLRINYKTKNSFSTNKYGSDIIVKNKKFKLLKKFKRRNNLPEDKIIDYNEYIYEKIKN